MTYITKRCGNCGFTHKASIYGYVHDPIGMPISRCPQCGTLYKDTGNSEWIQMTPFKKYRSIHPRGTAFAWFLGIFLTPVMAAPFAFLFKNMIALPLGLLLAVALAHYLLTCLHVGSEKFRTSYCDSILRTRNEEYRETLSKQGTLYDESIPNWVLCTKGAKKKIEAYLAEHADNTDFTIPTFIETIKNA